MSSAEVLDQIVRLQKLGLQPHIAEVVEQAEQALAAGRELEAEALVEKASALHLSTAS